MVMVQVTKKSLAQDLRKKGCSISEIAQELKMQKSGSISKWCRDIFLTSKQVKRLTQKEKSGGIKGRAIFLEKSRRIKKEETERLRKEGFEDIGNLTKKEFLIAGIAMYWSEGYKYSGGEQVGFTNSDSKMILFMLRWFKEICEVADDRISL